MKIDNFELFRKHLTFETKQDRYIVHVLRRPKDVKQIGNTLGSNECQRLLRTYYIDSLEYFDKKVPAIKELCESNLARAYILPQVRNNEDCLMNLAMKVLETIRMKNYSAKPEHLLRSAYCENHQSRSKVWILDLDQDCMTEYKYRVNFGGSTLDKKEWTFDEVLELVQQSLVECGKDPLSAYPVKTKSGYHIVTPPFDLQKAVLKCGLMYEGAKKHIVSLEEYHLQPGDKGYAGSPGLDTKYRTEEKEIVGWLHKDGMSLLYMNLPD